MNLFTFTGNLGRDCEIKALPSGTTICEFAVAVKSGYGNSEKTNWVKCALFGKRAEGQLPNYLKKGQSVVVSGELRLEEREGQNGKGAALAVSVDKIDLTGGQPKQDQPPANQLNQGFQNPNGTQGSVAPARGYQAPDPQSKQNLIESGNFDDDIPF